MGPIDQVRTIATLAGAAWATAMQRAGDVAEVGVPLWLTAMIGVVTLAVGVLGIRGQLLKAFDQRATEMATRIIATLELRLMAELHRLESEAARERATLHAALSEIRGQDQLAYLVNQILQVGHQRGKDEDHG